MLASFYISHGLMKDCDVAFPPTCIVEGCFLCLPGFLMHKSLIVFARIGISLIACIKGILHIEFLILLIYQILEG